MIDIEIEIEPRRPLALDRRSREVWIEIPRGRSFALDYASQRSTDLDGRLHIRDCRISKANVCEYAGAEIPGYESLGLDAGTLYPLYRDAAALKASAPTWENMPLMSEHIGVSAADPQKMLTVGSLSNVRWAAPYLLADLCVWAADSIAAIRDGSKREISCGYRYMPDMSPGTINGEKFVGRMLEISANHVALVSQGRVGPDCVVADSAPVFATDFAGAMARLDHERQARESSPLAKLIPNYFRL